MYLRHRSNRHDRLGWVEGKDCLLGEFEHPKAQYLIVDRAIDVYCARLVVHADLEFDYLPQRDFAHLHTNLADWQSDTSSKL